MRKLAAEAHQAADSSHNPDIKRVLLFIAAAYERLLRFAERRDEPKRGNKA